MSETDRLHEPRLKPLLGSGEVEEMRQGHGDSFSATAIRISDDSSDGHDDGELCSCHADRLHRHAGTGSDGTPLVGR